MAELAVLLRDGPHGASGTTRYALKCNDVAVSVAKTPIQIPIPQQSPELIDIGYSRPSVTLTGIVDTIGGNPSNVGAGSDAGYAGMSSIQFSRATVSDGWDDGGGVVIVSPASDTRTQTYYIPYKNALEEACARWIFSSSTELEIEVGDALYPIASYQGYLEGNRSNTTRFVEPDPFVGYHSTGGAIYKVAIQQARFQVVAAKEDRYDFSIQFVAESRLDIPN